MKITDRDIGIMEWILEENLMMEEILRFR